MTYAINRLDKYGFIKPEALSEVDFFHYFQPIIEVASGSIRSYEALARTFDINGEPKSAGAFFTDPRVSSLSKLEIDQRLRRLTLSQVNNLPDNTQMTLNISPQWIDSLNDKSVIPTLQMIDQAGVDPKRIVIELTEINGDISRLKSVVNRYRQAGLKIAIDDFGAGFSQLDRVIALEPDIIKLDMQLFKQAVKGGIAEQVVKSLIDFSIKSGGQCVCEGVETEAEFNFGLKCGAQYMQGYLFAAAAANFLPTDTFTAQINTLREKFFILEKQKEADKIVKMEKIKEQVNDLRCILLFDMENKLANLKHFFSGSPDLIRFYLCDNQGYQITANYDYNYLHHGWQVNAEAIGFNWAWRPYFYQLMLLDPQQKNMVITSKSYQDQSSKQTCITLATFVDANRILLVDMVVN